MKSRDIDLILGTLAVVCAVALFLPAAHFQFVSWDDRSMVVDNLGLLSRTTQALKEFWTHSTMGLYTPLSYTLWWLMARIYTTSNPMPFHIVNILLHGIAVALVFVILLRFTEWPFAAFAGAMLFGLHPLQVEPVAWVSGMNNLLAAVFGLAAIALYLEFSRRRNWTFYLAASAMMALALLSKPTAVAVPLMCAVLDARAPWQRRLATLGPWLCAAAGIAWITRVAQPVPGIPLWQRPAVALDAFGFYVGKVFWPARLGIDYGRTPWLVWHDRVWIAPAVALLAIAVTLYALRRRFPYIARAVLVMGVGLLPVLGLASFDFQHFSTVADRYMYLAMLGPALLFCRVVTLLLRGEGIIVSAVVLAALAWRSAQLLPAWHDSDALAARTLAQDPDSTIANRILAVQAASRSQWNLAATYNQRALIRAPLDPEVQYNLGNNLLLGGDPEQAIEHYQLAIAYGNAAVRGKAEQNLAVARRRLAVPTP